jgi:D-alanyl-D-alanine carboxypeptidase
MGSPDCGLAKGGVTHQNSAMLPFTFEAGIRRISAWRSALFIGLLFLCQCALLAAAEKPSFPSNFDVTAIDEYISAHVQPPSRVGLSVTIVKDGQVVLARGYGQRSLAKKEPVEPNTILAIGSVSKQFTCAAVLLLAEDGKLSVNDPVAKYYPNLTRAKDITLLDLMNHVSGYPDYYPLDFVDRRMLKAVAEDDLLREYAGGKLDFEPGTKWSYSNTGYILLGRVVEKVSGQSLGTFLKNRIFQPLNMTQTFYETDTTEARLATGYLSFLLSDPEAIGPEASGWLRGAGGIYSTPSDLARWDMGLMDGKVLKPASYAIMTTARKLKSGKSAEYGCGLTVKSQNGWQILSHNGAVSGFNAYNAMVPATRSAVIVLCNLEGSIGSLPNQILGLMLKESSNVPKVSGPAVAEAVKAVFAQLQKGKVNREQFSEEFNHYLTDAKVSEAAKRLERFGEPKKVEVLSSNERGGMEVTTARLTSSNGDLRVLMYRKPDGKIEQFFVTKE